MMKKQWKRAYQLSRFAFRDEMMNKIFSSLCIAIISITLLIVSSELHVGLNMNTLIIFSVFISGSASVFVYRFIFEGDTK